MAEAMNASKRVGIIAIFEGMLLLVRSTTKPEQWVLPKGHIEPGEEMIVAAAREAYEECGLTGEILHPKVGIYAVPATSAWSDGNEAKGYPPEVVVTEWFLMYGAAKIPSPEGREVKGFFFEDAMEALAWAPELKSVLRRIIPSLNIKHKPKVWGVGLGEKGEGGIMQQSYKPHHWAQENESSSAASGEGGYDPNPQEIG